MWYIFNFHPVAFYSAHNSVDFTGSEAIQSKTQVQLTEIDSNQLMNHLSVVPKSAVSIPRQHM